MKNIFLVLLFAFILSGSAYSGEWDDPDWLHAQTVNILTEKHGFKLVSVTSFQNALHYHLEKRNRASDNTYVTCINSYDADSSRHLHCFKP